MMSISTNNNDGTPLDERILQIVQQCPNHTIRPAKLASELGISVNDACAELCGLLQAVGGGENGASFVFETANNKNEDNHGDETATTIISAPPVMVFTFPPDFQRLARNFKRKQTTQQVLLNALFVCVKILKILTAFGLILSLLIVTVLGMMGICAAIVAMSRSGGGGHDYHRSQLMRRLQSMFFTFRQLLWCYAMFGGTMEGQDPFLREAAYDLALCSSLCCGNPSSLWFWFRASQLRRRQRGWTRRYGSYLGRSNSEEEVAEGVTLLNRGTWGQAGEDDDDGREGGRNRFELQEHRGLLSVAVEFLFGPTPSDPGPTSSEKWKMRGAVLVHLSSSRENDEPGVALEELAPYADVPPPSLDRGIVQATVGIIAHFNGVPVKTTDASGGAGKARFFFPELMAESDVVQKYTYKQDDLLDDGSLMTLFYAPEVTVSQRLTTDQAVPSSLQEGRYVLTKLPARQFVHCVLLGVLNFFGVLWVRQSLEPGGVLDMSRMEGSLLATLVKHALMPVLHFYSMLFFAIPLGRLLWIVVLNSLIEGRNRKRADLAYALQERRGEGQH